MALLSGRRQATACGLTSYRQIALLLHYHISEMLKPGLRDFIITDDDVMLNVLGCQLTYEGQVVTSAEARFNNSLRPRKPEGSLGRTAQDGHLDSHTAPEL